MSDANPGKNDAEELPFLTMLRFPAAFWVMLSHTAHKADWLFGPSLIGQFFRKITERGDYGVKLFFTLSGFILVYAYGRRDFVKAKSFFVARFARIYPMYFFGLILAFRLLLLDYDSHLEHYHEVWKSGGVLFAKSILVLTLFQSWLPSAALGWNGVGWSLSVEAFFYVSFPFILKRMLHWSNKSLLWLLLVCLASEVFRYYALEHFKMLAFVVFPLFRLPDFLIGMVLGVIWLRGVRIPVWSAFLAAGMVFVATAYEGKLGMAAFLIVNFGFWSLILALARPQAPQRKFSLAQFLQLLGHGSYGVYLVHFAMYDLLGCAEGYFKATESTGHYLYLSYLAFCPLFCIFTYLYYETPARLKIRALLRRIG